jgi:hypothetical protein
MLVAAYDGIHWIGTGQNNYDVMAAHNLYPGAKLQIGLQLPQNNATDLQKVGNGQYDDKIRRLARAYKNLKQDIFLRIGYEFNGPWNGYNPTAYINAYRRVVDIFRAEGVTNVAFVWNSWTPQDTNMFSCILGIVM